MKTIYTNSLSLDLLTAYCGFPDSISRLLVNRFQHAEGVTYNDHSCSIGLNGDKGVTIHMTAPNVYTLSLTIADTPDISFALALEDLGV